MNRLSKQNTALKAQLATRLTEAYEALSEAIEAFNQALADPWQAVVVAQEALNEVITEANAWKSDLAQQMHDYYDERSERWQASDTGQGYLDWIQSYEEEIEEMEVHAPAEVELPGEDPGAVLDELPEEAG